MAKHRTKGDLDAKEKLKASFFSKLKEKFHQGSKLENGGQKAPLSESSSRYSSIKGTTSNQQAVAPMLMGFASVSDSGLVAVIPETFQQARQNMEVVSAQLTTKPHFDSAVVTRPNPIQTPLLSSPHSSIVLEVLRDPPIKATDEPAKETTSPKDVGMAPISELWNEAYEELRKKEKHLIEEYEKALLGSISATFASTLIVTGSRLGRRKLMQAVIKEKQEEIEEKTIKFPILGRKVTLKDMAAPAVSVIKWADKYISAAVSANPMASAAWAGVSLLLPVS